MTAPRWGLVATVKAPLTDILAFAAHHLDLGAHRLYIYLDAPHPQAFAALKAHPKIRVTLCDDAYWARTGRPRPAKHQVRQVANATHAYARRAEVDWLAHIDVDEFLWPQTPPLADLLAALPSDTRAARVRPIEALAGGDGTAFKAFLPSDTRRQLAEDLYPTFGRHIRGGFLSHVAGKLLMRTGLAGVELRIHNAMQDGAQIASAELASVDLCHLHAKPWQEWRATYRYRLEKGSYRPDLPPNVPREDGGMTLHDLFTHLEQSEGEAGLRALFDEVCADTPALRARLDARGLLRHRDLALDSKIQRHFPDFR